MKTKSLLFLITILFFLKACIQSLSNLTSKENVQGITTESDLSGIVNYSSAADILLHKNLPFDKSDFFKGILEANDLNRNVDFHVYGGIVPHHLLPSFIIADFFRSLSNQKIDTIVLIGPDHYEEGKKNMVTSRYAWETEFGIIKPDLKIIDGLVSNQSLVIDEDTVLNDHSIFGILPFIKYYLPDTKIVPVLVSSYSSKTEIELFVENLAKFHNDNVIMVASVDFSHYLNSAEAQSNDEETIGIIKGFYYEKLLSLNNDFLDSPASVASVMMMMQKLGKTDMKILHHLNASDITGNVYEETTSYFSIYYY